MSHRRREISQSAENVVNPTAGICRIADGKYRNYYEYCILINLNLYAIITIFIELNCKLVGLNVCKMFIDRVIWIFCLIEFGKS